MMKKSKISIKQLDDFLCSLRYFLLTANLNDIHRFSAYLFSALDLIYSHDGLTYVGKKDKSK